MLATIIRGKREDTMKIKSKVLLRMKYDTFVNFMWTNCEFIVDCFIRCTRLIARISKEKKARCNFFCAKRSFIYLKTFINFLLVFFCEIQEIWFVITRFLFTTKIWFVCTIFVLIFCVIFLVVHNVSFFTEASRTGAEKGPSLLNSVLFIEQ